MTVVQANPPRLDRISDYPAWFAARTPDAEAMVLDDRRWTYAAMRDAIDQLARALVASGIGKGDRVATLQTPHPDYLIAFLATASIGAIWIGLNPRYTLDELVYVIGDAAPRVLLTRTRIGERAYDAELAAFRAATGIERIVAFDGEPSVAEVTRWRDFIAAGGATSDALLAAARGACGGRDPCLIVYTSGSTGPPKGALLHHDGLVGFCLEQNRLWPVAPLRAVNYFPINHVGCVVDVSLPVLLAGGTILFMEQFDPRRCLALMEAARATLWGSVPSCFQMQLALPDFDRFDLSSLQLILWEGAAMPREMIERLLRVHPRLATNYGMTETTSGIMALEPSDDPELLAETVGRAFPGVEVRLVGSDGQDVAIGATGEVWARSAYTMLGYWNRPDATAEALTPDGWFRTGDLAVMRPDGRYRIAGRLKEMFKSGGYNVYPREIEAVIEAHPAVAEVAVVSAEDPVWQEVGIAFVTAAQPIAAAELEAWCRARLANYKIPKRFVFEPVLPLLPIGKVDKAQLKRRAALLAN
ncbi:MAG: AMP-binding protein [Pseudomonadota bacterium]